MSVVTLIDEMLAEQQRLTAVERFARQHESGGLPAQARYYHALIPLEKPRPGEQYAFGVDLDLCTSCKACVSACHSLNGLDEDEIWRNVGFIHGGDSANPYQQTVTTACHHCVDPACLNGCPVEAYEKDEETGIVRHLDDQCIGCQYCTLKCPYDVPKYSKKRGIVRKCDMCYHRLAVNEAPACVQACPVAAITIRIVSKEATAAVIAAGDELVPGAFDSSYTKPTTAYVTRKAVPANARPADAFHLHREHAHWPLVWMLVLTQWAAGHYLAVTALAACAPGLFARMGLSAGAPALAILNAGLLVSVLHLGRPLGAWRFFLGLRRSWMSREILAFSLFAGAAAAFTAWPLLPKIAPLLHPPPGLASWLALLPKLALPLGLATSLLGLAGVACSALIYIDTRRAFWKASLTVPKFFGTTLVLGGASLAAVLAWHHEMPFRWLLAGSAYLGTLLFAWEMLALRDALRLRETAVHGSALVQTRMLRGVLFARAGVTGAALLVSLAAILLDGPAATFFATLYLLLLTAGFVMERYCYFAAVTAPKMPGGIST